jgi:glycosyltransferase involved in cell wall biosynthesis
VASRAVAAGYGGRLWTIPHPAWPARCIDPAPLSGRPIIGAFGAQTASKRLPQLLRSFARLRCTHPEASLHVAGEGGAGVVAEGVVWHGRVEEDRLWSLMAACDICVALRAPTMGETSGIAVRALSLGKPLVVSDVGWFAELPDTVALKVAADATEEDLLAVALELLASNGRARAAMGQAAARYASREHDLGRVADLYAAALSEVVADTVGAAGSAQPGSVHRARRRISEIAVGG